MEKVIKYESILSENLYKELVEYIHTLMLNKSTSFTTSLLWDDAFKNNNTLIIRRDFNKSDIEIFNKIKKQIEDKIPYHINVASLHIFPNSSFINWHNDGHCDAALTIYLNEKWEDNWGGYLMYEDGNEIKAIKPEKNLGVLQKTPLMHCVTTTNIGAEYRMSLQFFMNKNKNVI